MFISSLRLDGDVPDTWPFTMAPIRHIRDHGLTFEAPVTFLVGENGSGKSTLVEAIAETAKIASHGGKAGTKYASSSTVTELGERLQADFTVAGLRLTGGPRKQRKGFFLRAETLFDLGQNVSGSYGFWEENLEEISHGEGFLAVMAAMMRDPGLYLMDEPEAALSFSSCLQLVGLIHQLAAAGSQIICATHSPILAATPGADVIELRDEGLHRTTWDDLLLVDHWRRFMADPNAYLRHVVGL